MRCHRVDLILVNFSATLLPHCWMKGTCWIQLFVLFCVSRSHHCIATLSALPVRDFPANLTSEPASMVQSANSSVSSDLQHKKKLQPAQVAPHQEELRCVVAIVRHGDRTPKQKLKVNMSESHILKYFHDQYVPSLLAFLSFRSSYQFLSFVFFVSPSVLKIARKTSK